MAYILVKTLPNHLPVTSKTVVHYSQVEFLIYKSETALGEVDHVMQYQITDDTLCYEGNQDKSENGRGELKKGPRIVICAKTAPPGSISSKDALCLSSDILPSGYSFHAPEGWSCSQSYDGSTNQLSFIFAVPVEGIGDFTVASIKLNSFFTRAQAGVCALDVRIENFSKYIPDVKETICSIPISKKYYLEILKFTSNGMRGNFFLHHGLPVLFEWDTVCDLDTPLELLVDGTFHSALQEFTGEKKMEIREKGDHTYTLKMILPEGEKTESIKIKDTRWKNIESANGMVPDLTVQNSLLFWKGNILAYHKGTVYQTALDEYDRLLNWTVLTKYNGDVQYEDTGAAVICQDELHLIGGTKTDSKRMFCSVYDLKAGSGTWTDYNTGQFSMISGGAAAASARYTWIVYAKQTKDSLLFLEYVPEKHQYAGAYTAEITGLKSFAIGIRGNVLYLALSTGEGIFLETCRRGPWQFQEAGRIMASPVWMQWISGCSEEFLLTNEGVYQETGWKNVEHFHPPYHAGTLPWAGESKGRVVSLSSSGTDTKMYDCWITDVL